MSQRWTTLVGACALIGAIGACTEAPSDAGSSSGSSLGATTEHTVEGVTFELPKNWSASPAPGKSIGKAGEGTALVMTVPPGVSSGNPADDFREALGPVCAGEITATEGITLGGRAGWDLRCDEAAADGAIRQLAVERDDTWYEIQFTFTSETPTSRRDAIVDTAARTWRFA